jgi:Type II secretion system (T2SS), protein G
MRPDQWEAMHSEVARTGCRSLGCSDNLAWALQRVALWLRGRPVGPLLDYRHSRLSKQRVVYGGVFYFGFIAKTGHYAKLKIRLVQQEMRIDAGQIALYRSQHGKPPAAFSDLGQPSEKNMFMTADPWGTQFKYTQLGDDHFELTSAGPDAKFGTSDDITEKF